MTHSNDDTEAAESTPRPSSHRERVAALVGRLAFEVDDGTDGALPRGEIAALRREDGALSPSFYKLAARILDDELAPLRLESVRIETERRWARVVHALAVLGGQHRRGAPSFGSALAIAELAEPRFLRLLRAEADAVDPALRAAVAPLAQKAITFDATDLAALVLSASPDVHQRGWDDGDVVRRRLARDYYRAQRKTQNPEGASS